MSADDRVLYWQKRAAERLAEWEKHEHDRLLEWFNERVSRERQLDERCTFLYGKCRAAGLTDAELVPGQSG